MRGTILSAVLSVAALGGCYATTDVGYRGGYYAGTTSSVYVSTPDLVSVSPGVQVVADYDEPVFYTDGFYWRFYNNGWYRSNHYATGWYYDERPPVAILQIDRPYAYARYRPPGYVVRNRGRYQPPETIVRDHRRPAYEPAPVYRGPGYREPAPVYRAPEPARPAYTPEPVVRDHRSYQPPPAAPPSPPPYQPAPRAPISRPMPPQPAPAAAPPPAERGPAPPVVRDHRRR